MPNQPSIEVAGPPHNRAEIAGMISRAFLASPHFAQIEPDRYSPEKIAASMEGGVIYVAVQDGEPIGAIALFPPDPESDVAAFRTSPSFGLLSVIPEFCRAGIGRRLVEAAEAAALGNGRPSIALSVTTRAPELIAAYRRWGYETVEEFRWLAARDPSAIMLKHLG